MQALLASLVFSMSVKDEAFKAGMAQARVEAKKTDQDFDRAGKGMTASIRNAAEEVNRAAIRIVDSLGAVERKVRNAGLALTAGLTLPLGLAAKGAKDTASDFQAAMGLVHSAMVTASPEQLEKLRAAALELGPAFDKSAIEAAAAMEALAKNGMSAADILNGGLRSALTLAVTGQTDLSSAADLTTDIVQQFDKSTSELPGVVNRVVGALDASKMSFDDYRLAAGQAGGVTGSLGYTFEDFNTALAATAPLFDSGSSAGTSFRAFLTSLAGKSEDARKVMKKLGLELYNTDGRAKSLAAIADELQSKMGNLSDKAKNVALDKMFGADGGQTAVALIKLGAKGINDVAAAIDKVTADQKMAILLDGEAHATQRLASSWEKLKIVIGEAGIIQAFTMVKNAAAAMVETIASAPPWFMKLVVAAGLVAAAAGPVTLAMLGLAKVALPLLLLRLGPVALGFATIINPVGVLLRLLAQLAVQAGGAAVIGRLGTALLGVAGPIGLTVTALSLLVPLIFKAREASEAYRVAQDQVSAGQSLGIDLANKLAVATGKARDEALSAAKANRVQAASAFQAARANLAKARSEAAAIRAKISSDSAIGGSGLGAAAIRIGGALGLVNVKSREQATANIIAVSNTLKDTMDWLTGIDTAIGQAEQAGSPKLDLNFDDPAKTKKGRKGRDTSADDEDYAAKLAEVRNAYLQANADATGGIDARYRADMDALTADRAAYARQLATDDALNDAKRKTLMAEKDKELAVRRGIVEDARFDAVQQRDYDLARAVNEAEQDRVRATTDLVDSLAGRRAGELRLLDLQRQQEEADLELILATKATSSAEWQKAQDRKAQLDKIYADRRAGVMRSTETPVESLTRALNRSGQAIAESVQGAGVSALEALNTELTDAVMNAKSLGDAFVNMGKRIIASLIDIAIQQAIIKPMANILFGTAGSDGKRSGGLLASIGSALGRAFGGGKAVGGPVSPSNWYVVGEKGPEVFAPGVSGTIIPNGGRGNGPARVIVEASPWFDVRAAGAAEPSIQSMGVRAAAGGSQMAQADANRAARRRIVR